MGQQQVWQVPYRRNPFFTGREDLLNQLHEYFKRAKTAALTQPPAITGLGGIGKTQLAVEYAYRHKDAYSYIFWVNAATYETLIEGFLTIARLLTLPAKDEQDQHLVVTAVQNWFATHDQWLLILDNADDASLVNGFLPTGDTGHILLTTRESAWGPVAENFAVEIMSETEGMLFLLRRSKILRSFDTPLSEVSNADQVRAEEIVRELGALPLALDQAGAYIEETQSGLANFLSAYQRRQMSLLGRRGRASVEHPESISRTFSLSFEQVEKSNAAAADLLRFFAFLAPDAIPEELIIAGAPELGPLLRHIADDPTLLDEAIGDLLRFSLVDRHHNEKTLTVHRLVQAVLKASMEGQTQSQWAERTIRAIKLAFPEPTVKTRLQCQRLLPHAEMCAQLITHYNLLSIDAAHLLEQVGKYLFDSALYPQAESLLKQTLTIYEHVQGPPHLDTALGLNSLATLYMVQDNYSQAEPLFRRALKIFEDELSKTGKLDADVTAILNNLAFLYYSQGKYKEAEPLYQQALAWDEQVLGPEGLAVATDLNNLGLLYYWQKKYTEAESPYERALAIFEHVLGLEHPDTARSLNNLAQLYLAQDRDREGAPLLKQALEIRERVLGPDHPDTAESLNNLALHYKRHNQFAEAESLFQRALTIDEKTFGSDHAQVARDLHNLASLYQAQGHFAEAESRYKQALTIYQHVLGLEHPFTLLCLNNLAMLYISQERNSEAEVLFQQVLTIEKQILGNNHPDTWTTLNNLATLYVSQSRYSEAEPLLRQMLTIDEQVYGIEHPQVFEDLLKLTICYSSQGKEKEIKLLHRQFPTFFGMAKKVSDPRTDTSSKSSQPLDQLERPKRNRKQKRNKNDR